MLHAHVSSGVILLSFFIHLSNLYEVAFYPSLLISAIIEWVQSYYEVAIILKVASVSYVIDVGLQNVVQQYEKWTGPIYYRWSLERYICPCKIQNDKGFIWFSYNFWR